MPASESQLRATKKYDNDHYFKKLVRFRKEDEEAIRAAAGKSLNGFIVDAVMEKVNASRALPEFRTEAEPTQERYFTFPPKAKERTREEEVMELQKMQSETKQKMAMQKAELTEEEERNRDRAVSIFGKNEDSRE